MFTKSLKVKIFADCADKQTIHTLYQDARISGFTTNPTLMKKAGVDDYETFARDVLETVTDRPISFEVLSDDFNEMEAQASEIAGWGDNVYVKIPITNTHGETSLPLIERLTACGIKLNITAMTLFHQVESVAFSLNNGAGGYVSVISGRIADAGQDPVPIMCQCLDLLHEHPKVELIWASSRELYNILQADNIGCHIITLTADILGKLHLLGSDLQQVSIDTIKMFYHDAQTAGYKIRGMTGLTSYNGQLQEMLLQKS